MVAVTALCVSLASVPAIEQLVSRGLTAFITRPAGVGASKSVVAPSTAGKADTTPTTATPPTTAPASTTTVPASRSTLPAPIG
jgi:hypothetical protein